MSHLLDEAARRDPKRAADLERSDAALVASMFPLSEEDLIAADLAEDANKAKRRHAVNDRAALEAQVLNLDAMRRAGW